MPRVKSYSILAEIYEHLMRKIDYGDWADYLIDIADEFDVETYTALEFGAGNCKIFERVSEIFSKAIVSDNSLEMLKKFKPEGASAVCCDMRADVFNQKFDFIYAAFDTVNYLLSEEDFLHFLNSASNLLHENGIITFDASMPANSRKLAKRLNRKGKFKGYKYVQHSVFDIEKMTHTNLFSVESPAGEQFREEHIQKIFEFSDYFKMFDYTDLYCAGCFEAFTFEDADDDTARIQFVLKKRKNDKF